MERILHLKDLATIEPFSASFARLGDNYILLRISTGNNNCDNDTTPHLGLNKPMRMNGMLLILSHRGSLDMQINLEPYSIRPGDMVAVSPGSLITFTRVDSTDNDFTILFISTTFLHSINIDLNAINIRSIISHQRPVMRLDSRESDIVRKYFDLLDANTEGASSSMFAKQIARTLIAAVVYELFRFSFDRLGLDDASNTDRALRPLNYVHDFMHLLHLHYGKERNLTFYAEKLCISPKYLSMITKDATGKTATEWINHFVILEAKNMLRFSGKSIQQVAYALNFSSQSSFGKYFKRVTGQSPSDYQKS